MEDVAAVGNIRDAAAVFHYQNGNWGTGGRALFNFAETPWTPVRFRRGMEPPAMPRSWEWHPQWLLPGRDLQDEDYLLVRGGGRDPGSEFALRARAGLWSLYARDRD